MKSNQLKLSRKTRKDMVNALLKHDPTDLVQALRLGQPSVKFNRKTATKRVGMLAWRLSENVSHKNPRRRGTITMTIVKRWKEATQWLTVYCGQDKKTEIITYIYPDGNCDEQPGEVYVSY